jgi:tryptophan 2,3-dioxygenase
LDEARDPRDPAAIERVKADRLSESFKILARVKAVQRQLFEQWAVLETLTPSEYEAIRPALGSSSGFQSPQYRALEFLLGNKHADMIDVFRHDPAAQAMLTALLHAPSLYDEFLRHLARRGCPCRRVRRARLDATLRAQPRARAGVPHDLRGSAALVGRLRHVREARRHRGVVPALALPALKTVERIIGHKPGTGGSSGVAFLTRALDVRFFPELIDVRGEPLGAIAPAPRGA